MAKIDDILAQMKQNPTGVRFKDLCKIYDHFLVNLAKREAVIGFIKLHGKVIPESIFRTIKEKPKHIR